MRAKGGAGHSACQSTVSALALAVAACSQPAPAAKTVAEKLRPVEYFHVDSATAGKITGSIAFRGTEPKSKHISMDSDAGCPKADAGEQLVVTGTKGQLANAFDYIQSGLEGKRFEPPKEAVMLDQHGCIFVPRVIGLLAGQTRREE